MADCGMAPKTNGGTNGRLYCFSMLPLTKKLIFQTCPIWNGRSGSGLSGREHVSPLKRVGKHLGLDGRRLAILLVEHRSYEGARDAQR